MLLDERKRNILKAVVDDYIATAEPVGSKALVNRYHFNVSSATIRNEMAELEDQGYLEQPHTSAGRIPSDKGYRAYVDSLLQIEDLTAAEEEKIRVVMRNSLDELTGMIRRASTLLSEKTGYTSLALSPKLNHSHLQQIKMLMIEPGRALVVVVLSAGVVKDRLARVPEVLDAAQLAQIAAAIEEGLSGMKLDDITLVTVATAARNIRLPENLLNQVMYEAYVAIKQADNLEVYMEGSHKLLSYPEFQDVHKAREYLDILNRDGIIAGYMTELKEPSILIEDDEDSDPDDHAETSPARPRASYVVRIGQEIMLEGLTDCSFVTTTYKMGDVVAGRIGVIGPRRMAYGKVISNISFIKQILNEEIRRLTTGEDRMEVHQK
ncbi:MAG: heat-inducible transcriptional repressor HrcA [Saccharofermentanales bacterium]|jgi:heat-inducible transcriptional repressor|nr:heat-inducible transcription repressor HrcA [Clostridiaceae bacterium]